jgi:hypothetical protein
MAVKQPAGGHHVRVYNPMGVLPNTLSEGASP